AVPGIFETAGSDVAAAAGAVAETAEHGNRYQLEKLFPVFPARNLLKIVGAHHPDEMEFRISALELAQRIDRIARPESALDIDDENVRMAADGTGRFNAFLERRHAGLGLERVLRADQPPDFIEIETLERIKAHRPVAFMGRIEGAAKEADTASGAQRIETLV